MAKYSIILPVRNGGKYIKNCVESILAQTYTDFNFIVLDNCSTDGTREWIESVKDERIKVITAERPLSIEESWARITTIDKNQFITILGHDDILYPDFLYTIDGLINQYPNASLYLTHFDLIDADGKLIRHCKPMQISYPGDELLQAILTNSIDLMGTGYVMRAIDYDRIGGIPVKYPSLLYADFELWVEMAAINFESVSPSNCFAFRMHQSTAHSSQDGSLHKAIDLLIDYLAELKNKDGKMRSVIDKFGVDFLLFSCRGLSHRLLRTDIDRRQGMTVKQLIRQTKIWAKKIGLDKEYFPEKIISIKVARTIDSNKLLRKIFLIFKKIFPKSIIRK